MASMPSECSCRPYLMKEITVIQTNKNKCERNGGNIVKIPSIIIYYFSMLQSISLIHFNTIIHIMKLFKMSPNGHLIKIYSTNYDFSIIKFAFLMKLFKCAIKRHSQFEFHHKNDSSIINICFS